jgi:hypothetical protein
VGDRIPRAYPRYALEVAVELRSDGFRIAGRSRDISRGGLCLQVPRQILPGTALTARLSLVFDADTFSEPIELPARAVWCTAIGDRFQVGASFRQLTADNMRYLEMFLRYLEGAPGDEVGEDTDDTVPGHRSPDDAFDDA